MNRMTPMNIERRNTALAPVTLIQRADKTPLIVGYGAVFYDGTPKTEFDLGSGMVERIAPRAFDRAVKEDDTRGLFNHDPNLLLGRTTAGTMRLSVDSKGLRYEIDPPDTAAARDVMELLRRGDVTGSSFSFKVDEQRWTEEKRDGETIQVREILAVHLFDVSPVVFPAYLGSDSGLRGANHQQPPTPARVARTPLLDDLSLEIQLAEASTPIVLNR